MAENRSRNIVQKTGYCLSLVVSKMPDNQGNTLAVVQTGIIKSVFIKSTYHKRNLYDISYKIAADYNLFYHAYLLGEKFQYVPLDISIYEAEDGVSSRMYMSLCVECGQINGKANTFLWSEKLYLQVFWHNVKHTIKPLFPQKILKSIYNYRFNNKR